jgi:hypothetical protein
MEVNDAVLFWSTWSTAFAMWLLVYMYGFWQLVRSAERKLKIAYLWVGFLSVWLMSIPVAVVIKRFM